MCQVATILNNSAVDTLNGLWEARISASGSSLATSLGFWDICSHSRFLTKHMQLSPVSEEEPAISS